MSKSIDHLQFEKLYQLQSYFHKDDYRKDPSRALHFLIINGHTKTIEWMNTIKKNEKSWIQEIRKSGGNPFDIQDPKSGLTPLHLSAIKGNVLVLERLLEENANPFTPDHKGWTAYIHAFVNDRKEILAVLQAKGCYPLGEEAISDAQIQQRHVFQRTARLLNEAFPEPEEQVFFYLDHTGHMKAGSALQFKEMTGAFFTPCFFATRERLIADRAAAIVPVQDIRRHAVHDYYKKIYSQADQEPSLYLARSEHSCIHASLGWGVKTNKKVRLGTFLVAYLGKQQLAPDPSRSVYVCGRTDGKHQRNLGPMIQDSFPKAVLIELSEVDGLNSIPIIVAGRDMQKDEEVTYHYGYGQAHVKWGLHVELNQEEMEKYFLEHPVVQLAKELSFKNVQARTDPCVHASEEKIQEFIALDLAIARLRYIFHTPSSMAHLVLKGIICAEDALTLMNDSEFLDLIQADAYKQLQEEITELLTRLCTVKNKLVQLSQKNKQAAQEMNELLFYLLPMVSAQSFNYILLQMIGKSASQWLKSKKTLEVQAKIIHELRKYLYPSLEEDVEEAFAMIAKLLPSLPSKAAKGIVNDILPLFEGDPLNLEKFKLFVKKYT